ncbi:cytosol aminopeptidase-like isoform X1 [Clytia hemisphaerica]|uniref:Cytosol aminopeptidase n=1 Tax=Clytia hemisphaerica TaxID=252671 RepID=A0A7M5XDC2_9CNID
MLSTKINQLSKTVLLRKLLIGNVSAQSKNLHGIVAGCYQAPGEDGEIVLTGTTESLNTETGGKLLQALNTSNFDGKPGSVRTFTNLSDKYPLLTVCGLGEENLDIDENECLDERKENVRIGAGAGAKELKKYKVDVMSLDDCGDAQSAAEGVGLSTHSFQEFKSKKENETSCTFNVLSSAQTSEFEQGLAMAEGQNWARDLMETPSNFKYPELFADKVVQRFSAFKNVDVIVRDDVWAREKGMDCFLSVGKGSDKKPMFVELHYNQNADEQKKVVLVGKGITFDTGGISIKPSSGMGLMRGDMGGAACVLATLHIIAKLKLPVNLSVLVPMAENMPSDRAAKPGDVFTALNGKTVEVDNTDAEGRMILADALCYADEFQPSTIIDVATLTGAIDVALGGAAAGAYTTCNNLWQNMEQASYTTGDRFWRMPLYKHYTKQMKCSLTADLRNTQKKARSAGSATAAAFLKEFVTIKSWAHLDIAGVMDNSGGELPYLNSGMSGRPTRTLVETVRNIFT